nr:ulp1 protease family, C-terminal catalytic domain-containing protein [Tanacetum cinerariifolium]
GNFSAAMAVISVSWRAIMGIFVSWRGNFIAAMAVIAVSWWGNFTTVMRARKEKRHQKQSNVEKEKADIRKRLHLLKEDMDDRSYHVKKVYYRWMAHEDCAMSQFVTIKKEIV